MSPKELLYLEDALNHEQFLKCQISESSSKLSDTELKNFVTSMTQNHKDIYNSLYKAL